MHALPFRRRPSASQLAALAGALGVTAVALGPVDALAERGLFSAHMLQHLMLAIVMPPLLLLGTPAGVLRPLLRHRPVLRVARVLTHPMVAFLAYNGVLAVMHTPPVFERMVRDESVHIALHLVLMAVGILAWFPLLSPVPEVPRLSYPAQMLYLFLMLIPMAAVSAPITLADRVLYPWYERGQHPLGLSPLADQIWGGLLMWVGGGLYFMAVMSLIFARWSRREDMDVPRAALVGRPRGRRTAA
jgi:putative membrane protein